MKIRNGFVSNSSSSSFICMGINVYDIISPEENDDIYDILKNLEKEKQISGLSYISGDYDGLYYGNVFFKSSEGFNDVWDFSTEKFNAKRDELIEKLKIMFPKQEKFNVKLYFGSVYS